MKDAFPFGLMDYSMMHHANMLKNIFANIITNKINYKSGFLLHFKLKFILKIRKTLFSSMIIE